MFRLKGAPLQIIWHLEGKLIFYEHILYKPPMHAYVGYTQHHTLTNTLQNDYCIHLTCIQSHNYTSIGVVITERDILDFVRTSNCDIQSLRVIECISHVPRWCFLAVDPRGVRLSHHIVWHVRPEIDSSFYSFS